MYVMLRYECFPARQGRFLALSDTRIDSLGFAMPHGPARSQRAIYHPKTRPAACKPWKSSPGRIAWRAVKNCFINKDRPCDLTCKAAFEVDDPVDNVDCYFIWLAYHFGEGLFELKRVAENFDFGGGPSPMGPGGPGSSGPGPIPGGHGSPGGYGPGPKNFPKN